MWKSLQKSKFFLLFKQEKGYEIYLTNYVAIWFTYFSRASFIACFQKSNEGLEFDNDDDLIQKGTRMLLNPDQLKKISIKEYNGESLSISMTVSYGYPFKLECLLTKGSEELIITQQLLSTIKDLRSSETELRLLMKRKDKEIEEYKCEGGKIALRCLKTVIYNDETHMNGHKVYEDMFGQSDIPDSLLEKKIDIPQTSIVKQEPSEENKHRVKIEPNNVKSEIEMQTFPRSETTRSITATVNVKQEATTEMQASVLSPRKKSKKGLNY